MKYSIDESMQQITEKSRELKIKKQRRNVGFIAVSAVSVMVAVIATIYSYAGLDISGMGPSGNSYVKYGAFMVPNEAGGYILVGVVCFVLAVVFTLMCLKFKEKSRHREEKEKIYKGKEVLKDE